MSFTQHQRTLLVPWDHLERVELYRMRTGRWGGHVRMVGLHVDDIVDLVRHYRGSQGRGELRHLTTPPAPAGWPLPDN